VRLVNNDNGRFKARASIVLRRIENTDQRAVGPVNIALAEGRCTDCQTIAVALQVVLYQRGASTVTPQNIAIAANIGCTRCITVARAMQFVVPVDDPNAVPDSVRALVRDMDRELRYFSTVHSLSELDPDVAMQRLNTVLQQYQDLVQYITQLQDVRRTGDDGGDRSASPSPSAPLSPSTTPTPSGTGSTSPTATSTPTPSPTP